MLEVAGLAIAVALYVALISLPGIGITCFGWWCSGRLRPVSAQTFLRAGLIATAITPVILGARGILPAIFLT